MAVSSVRRANVFYELILPILVLSCLGLAIGLTYAPCHSSMCVEEYFPLQTRAHIGLFYGLLVGVGLALWIRIAFQRARVFCEWQPMALDKVVFVTGKRVSMGAILLFIWIAGLTFGGIGYWYPAQNVYWYHRGELANWTQYMFRLTWTGVTGHWIDIWLGLVVMPVGRNSVLGKVFQLQYPTLLFAHKLLAYALCVGSLIHGLLYYSFLGAWAKEDSVDIIEQQFTPDDPALTAAQLKDRGPYYYLVLPTGAVAGLLLIPVIVITALPVLRRLHYNTFYFIHIIFAALTMIFTCIHASTSFYCLLPGLLLWIGDWAWRLRHSLATTTDIQVEDASNGWYRIRIPDQGHTHSQDGEKGHGNALPHQPLMSYQINIPQISRLQSHAFTVAAHTESGPVTLLRKGPERKKAQERDKEWTWKLVAMIDHLAIEKSLALRARIEGPYIEHVPHFDTADHVLAIAGGTGITGALSIASLWLADRASGPTKSLRLVWTVRDEAAAQLEEVEQLRAAMKLLANADLIVQVSSHAGRIDPSAVLQNHMSVQEGRSGEVWVYASGPAGLLKNVDAACTEQRRRMRTPEFDTAVTALNWHIASFVV